MREARTAGRRPETMPTNARMAEEDIAFVVGGLVHLGVEGHRRDEIGDEDGNDHSDDAGEEGEGEAFEEELLEDVARASTEGFEEADLAGAFGDGDEHDVHDANASDAESHGSDDSEEEIEGGAELHDVGGVGDGVPTGNGLVVFGIEVVAI